MSSTLDSHAAFQSRALELGMSKDVLDLLTKGGIKSFGDLAFASPYQVGQADESPLISALKVIMGRDPTVVPIRRLWFESSSIAMGEFKNRLERVDSSEPIRLAIAERAARLEEQRKNLAGVHISCESEPSHRLVDTVFQQAADQLLVWLPWEKLTSRAQEVLSQEPDMSLFFDNAGQLKLNRKLQDAQCDLSGELQIRQALKRRALAHDLAKLCDFQTMEAYHEERFALLIRKPPVGSLSITMAQLRESDKQLFLQIADQVRDALTLRPDGTEPMQKALLALKDHPQVQFCLIPAPKPSARFAPYELGSGKGNKGKGKGKGSANKGKGSGVPPPPVQIPAGCVSKTRDGKPLCYPYNGEGCRFAKDGRRCRRGFHLCWKCLQPHSYSACPAKGGA